MKLRSIRLYILLAVSFLSLAFTQKIFGGVKGDEWKPVDPKELALKEPKVEKGADAEAIFWDVNYDVDLSQSTKVKTYIRIKIFTERGREEFSKIKILSLPDKKVEDIAARVIKPNGTIIELKKTDIFDSTIIQANSIAIKAKTFVVPNLEVGSILEYRYKEEITDRISFYKMMFQQEIPAQSITNCAKVKDDSGKSDVSKNHSTNMGQIEFVKNDDFYCATKQNVPSFHTEPFMPPEERMKPWVRIGSIRVEERGEEEEKAYWTKRAGTIYQNEKKYFEVSDDVKMVATEITLNAKSDEEKLALVFEYCKTQIKNIDFDFTMSAKERETLFFQHLLPTEILKRKAGRSWDINHLFIALTMALGFDTRIVGMTNRNDAEYLSQDDKPNNKSPSFKIPCAGVVLGNRVYYFAPSERYIPIGMLPWENEGQRAILIGPKSYLWSNITLSGPDKSVEKRSGKFKLSEDGTLEGEVRIEYTGHIGWAYKVAYNRLTQTEREDNLKEIVKRKLNTALVTNIRIENAQDPIRNFTYIFNVRIPNYAQLSGSRLFIQPNFFEYGSVALFTSSTRIHPVFFKYTWSEEDNIEIELPQGFRLETASGNNVAVTSHFAGLDEIQTDTSEDGKILKYKRKFKFGTNGELLYKVSLYNTLKTFFESTHKNATQLITLKQN